MFYGKTLICQPHCGQSQIEQSSGHRTTHAARVRSTQTLTRASASDARRHVADVGQQVKQMSVDHHRRHAPAERRWLREDPFRKPGAPRRRNTADVQRTDQVQCVAGGWHCHEVRVPVVDAQSECLRSRLIQVNAMPHTVGERRGARQYEPHTATVVGCQAKTTSVDQFEDDEVGWGQRTTHISRCTIERRKFLTSSRAILTNCQKRFTIKSLLCARDSTPYL